MSDLSAPTAQGHLGDPEKSDAFAVDATPSKLEETNSSEDTAVLPPWKFVFIFMYVPPQTPTLPLSLRF